MNEAAILGMAPDPGTANRVSGFSEREAWWSLGRCGQVGWGATGPGTRPFQVVFEWSPASVPAYRCSCPAQKTPCAHVLGLMVLWCRRPSLVPVVDMPPNWVVNWQHHRQRQEARTAVPQKVLPASAAPDFTIQPKRLAQMTEGMALLELRLTDLLRQGLATLEDRAETYWSTLAARLVDAKLGGVARRLRALPAEMQRTDWPAAVLSELASIFLLARAFRHLEGLPEGLRTDLLILGGWSPRKEEVLRLAGTADRWLVVGQTFEKEDDHLMARRTWLFGAGGRFALVLDFSWRDAGFDREWPLGTVWRGLLHYYPSAYPLRAVAGEMVPERDAFTVPPGFTGMEAMWDAYAEALAKLPWIPAFPVCLEGVVPLYRTDGFYLVDRGGALLPVAVDERMGWTMVALGAGRPITVLGIWEGASLVVFLAVSGGRFRRLQPYRAPSMEAGEDR